MNQREPSLMIVADAPCASRVQPITGFGRVVRRLTEVWRPHFKRIDVWGIGYIGQRHHAPVDHIFPANGVVGGGGADWRSFERFAVLTRELLLGNYTHIFLLQDSFNLSAHKFPKWIAEEAPKNGWRTVVYFPVDAPLDPEWCAIAQAVDVPVCYTEYGRQEILKHAPGLKRRLQVAPHGVEPVFRMLEKPMAGVRPLNLKGNTPDTDIITIEPGEYLIFNVGYHQRRKDHARSLQVLAALRRMGVPAKLLFHFGGGETSGDGVSLSAAGRQLGLVEGRDWSWTRRSPAMRFHQFSDADLNTFYNAADLVLTTTLGEGWGLTITEALAAGCPVAAPEHTSVKEIFDAFRRQDSGRCIGLPMETSPVSLPFDNSRLRYPVDVDRAAGKIRAWLQDPKPRRGLSNATREWLSWQRIGEQFLAYFFDEAFGAPVLGNTNVGSNEEPGRSTPRAEADDATRRGNSPAKDAKLDGAHAPNTGPAPYQPNF